MASVEPVDSKNCKKEIFKKNKKKRTKIQKNFSGVGSILAWSRAHLVLLNLGRHMCPINPLFCTLRVPFLIFFLLKFSYWFQLFFRVFFFWRF